MPGTKEIRMKIRSVQNTRKITKAMEMVAASKMRKAQERMRAARPYGEKIRNVADIGRYESNLYRFLETRHPSILTGIAEKKQLDDAMRSELENALKEFGEVFAKEPKAAGAGAAAVAGV